ncbi:MAG: prepilin-type N-terminal cleavage/methylation domain-containing protein [Phycisphaerae bacterium]|nr:prepilin-type N-terminal cleavage/methylation domain-containing protein [Phycisphaerae bacterium]
MEWNRKRYRGVTLVEVVVTMAVAAIPLLAVGTLLVGAQNSWEQTYATVHKPIREDASILTTAFTTVGRKSNRSLYFVYRINNGAYTVATPPIGSTLAEGQAVEFRYWSDGFDEATATLKSLETTNTGTDYALFYLDGTTLKVDYGKVVGGVGAVSGGQRNTAGMPTTVILAEDVDIQTNDKIFSHTVISGAGQGCVRLNTTLKDEDGDSVEIKTAALCRAVWPR